jgi:hypothetical protein
MNINDRRVDFASAMAVSSRPPTSKEVEAAVNLGKDLNRVTYPDRAKIRVREELPPGRISTRQLMLREVQLQNRQPLTARPFSRKKRAKTIHTPITVGIMADVSGSMYMAQEPLAVARWVLADALHQVQGKVATVLFGNDGYPIQSAKERVRDVQIYNGSGSHEDFESGFSLLDAELDLIDGHGARLLVCITDGHFVLGTAVEYAEYIMQMCQRKNVGVIWLDVNGYFARPDDAFGFGSIVNVQGLKPVEVAEVLGRAVVEEFKRVAPQHS